MQENIFEQAANYDFDAIKEYFESGHSINICDESGSSLFAAFIDGYSRHGDNEDELEKLKEHDLNDKFWYHYLTEKQKTPLQERNGGKIVEQLDWFLQHGADINLNDLTKSGDVETPLSFAIRDEDFYLAEYLLEHGADPKVWLSDERFPWEEHEDYLIEHMDVMMFDSSGERFENELRIAALLAHYGLDDFFGYCLSIDRENRTINGHKPNLMY